MNVSTEVAGARLAWSLFQRGRSDNIAKATLKFYHNLCQYIKPICYSRNCQRGYGRDTPSECRSETTQSTRRRYRSDIRALNKTLEDIAYCVDQYYTNGERELSAEDASVNDIYVIPSTLSHTIIAGVTYLVPIHPALR